MRTSLRTPALVSLLVAGLALSAHAAPGAVRAGDGTPKLVTADGRTRLFVNGKPFLVLGGELSNSSAGSLPVLQAALRKVTPLGLNTILVPVSWELVEPVEGNLDFTLVGHAIREARRNNLSVVLLWFGSWKNGMSSYVPAWVKHDQRRFPRAELAGARGIESLSAFSATNRDADARAFAGLMRYVRSIDERTRTVVMVQVENEVGLIGATADRSIAAAAAYRAPVPVELLHALPPGATRTGDSWEEVFGRGLATEERFQAWHFARYVDAVARAGKAQYPLPMLVNAALNRAGQVPGEYPSGGPLPHLLDVWRAGAPTIDIVAPDLYAPAFAAWCDRYRRADNPLFIPEMRNGDDAAANVLYAAGQQAIGVSPFAIDTITPPSGAALEGAYDLLAKLAPPLLAAPPGRSAGVLVDKDAPATEVTLGAFKLTVSHDYTFPWSSPGRNDPFWPRGGGLIIALGDDEFLIAGDGIIVTFAPASGEATAGIERIDEGSYEGGQFVVSRRLNGDDTNQGRHLRLPMGDLGLQRVKLYRYR